MQIYPCLLMHLSASTLDDFINTEVTQVEEQNWGMSKDVCTLGILIKQYLKSLFTKITRR